MDEVIGVSRTNQWFLGCENLGWSLQEVYLQLRTTPVIREVKVMVAVLRQKLLSAIIKVKSINANAGLWSNFGVLSRREYRHMYFFDRFMLASLMVSTYGMAGWTVNMSMPAYLLLAPQTSEINKYKHAPNWTCVKPVHALPLVNFLATTQSKYCLLNPYVENTNFWVAP